MHSYLIVSLTGFGGNANHWAQNVPDLNPYYRVFALDLLGKPKGKVREEKGIKEKALRETRNRRYEWSNEVSCIPVTAD
jgi:hypothetical protein